VKPDTAAYAQAVDLVENGQSMYDPLPHPGPHRWACGPGCATDTLYLYPPVVAPLFSLVSDGADPRTLNGPVFLAAMVGLVMFAICVGVLAGLRGAWLVTFASGLILWGIWLDPLAWYVNSGNIQPLLWGIVAGAAVLPIPLGVALLTFGGAIKVVPGWGAIVLVVRAPREALIPLVVVATAVLAATVTVIGPTRFAAEVGIWVGDVAPTLAQGQFIVGSLLDGSLVRTIMLHGNLSPVFAPLYLSGDPYPNELPGLAKAYLTLASVGIPLFVAWRTRSFEARKHAVVVLAAAVLAAPIFRLGYLPLVVPGAVVLWKRHRSIGAKRISSLAQPSEVPRKLR
jgi:hypothetical protein